MERDDIVHNMVQWIELSNTIFDIIGNFPRLTCFSKQQINLQEFIKGKLTSQLSNAVKESFFIGASQNIHRARSDLHTYISNTRTQLTRDFDDYMKKNVVSDEIKRFQQEFLVSQIELIEDSWDTELIFKIDELRLRQEVNTGEGRKKCQTNTQSND